MIHDRDRLQELLGHEDLAWLVARIRQQLERGRPLTGVVSLSSPSPGQRDAADRLLGRRPSRGRVLRVPIPALLERLRSAAICDDLEDVVGAFGAPLVDRQALADQRDTSWREMEHWINEYSLERPALPLSRWWERLREQGVLLRLAGGELDRAKELLAAALRVVAALPAQGIPLSELAAATLGDGHGLDRGMPVGTLVQRILEDWPPPDDNPQAALTLPQSAAARRQELWARVGVDTDALGSSVLLLNLPARDRGLTGETLRRYAADGEPVRLTGRQLYRHPPDLTPLGGRAVFICENPSVLAAAAHRLGARCAPILCTEGQPRVPFHALAARVVSAGGTLRVRADFDWTGVGIVAALLERYAGAAHPWRMKAEDYLTLPAGPPVRVDRRRDTPWDTSLAEALMERGVAAHEEGLLPELIEDLREPTGC